MAQAAKNTAQAAQAALTPQQQARANVAAKVPHGIGVTLHCNGAPIKGLAAQPLLAKPTMGQLRTITAIKGHPGNGNCIKRWHLYSVGHTLLHAKLLPGMVPSDVTFWAQLGYLTLSPPTPAQYQAAVAAWRNGTLLQWAQAPLQAPSKA